MDESQRTTRLREHVAAVNAAEDELWHSRRRLDRGIADAIAAGMTAYRVAQITGLSQPTVAKARDRAQRP